MFTIQAIVIVLTIENAQLARVGHLTDRQTTESIAETELGRSVPPASDADSCQGIPIGDDGVNQKFRFMFFFFFFLRNTYVQQASVPNSTKFSYLLAILTHKYFLQINVFARFNALQRALQRVKAR